MMSRIDNEAITRQTALNKIGKAAKKLGLITSPLLAIGAVAEQDLDGIDNEVEITRLLNDILHMKFLLQLLYTILNKNKRFVPSVFSSSFEAVKSHHTTHVLAVKSYIGQYGSKNMIAPFLDANFNTANLTPAKKFDDFLQIAQVLEDASASLFKKNLPELHELNINKKIFRYLHLMHTVDARHAAYIRMVRAERGVTLNPWISSTSDNGVNEPMKNIYENENNVKQTDINVPSTTSAPVQAVKEGWDEPCSNDAVNRLFRLFNVNYY